MNAPAERLFARQLARAGGSESLHLPRLAELVIAAYAESDRERRRREQTARTMATELEEVNEALEHSVRELREQNLRFALALDNMANGLALFSPDGRLVVCNHRQREILELPDDCATISGCSFEGFLGASPLLSDILIRERVRLAKANTECELVQTLLNGREVRVFLRPTADGGLLCSCEDVTERNRAAERIAYLAYHDTLTELPNRALLRDRLDQALQSGPFAVLCIDLDGFKVVNDTLGHAVGDALLRAVTLRLRHQVRAGETLARIGGDEFAVLIEGDLDQAISSAARMIETVGAPFEIDGHMLNIGTSIGIAVAPRDGNSREELLRHADLALYRAKAEGRGCLRVFQASMDTEIKARCALERELRAALSSGQFELQYQPQVRLKDNQIIAFEALLRWRHPVHGLIGPDAFIPMAEECGLIVPIGEWVMREACRQAATWPGAIGVAVNVSAVQLGNDDLFQIVASALQESGLAPSRLEVEVTETAMLSNSGAAHHVMRRLRAIGVRIAMDDFGTGYSSLNYLQSFPFDRIKIDRSFVLALGKEAKALAIVRAVVGLGSSLGIAVTAEGVETHDQLEALLAERCNDVQGFLYSQAVSGAVALGMVQQPGPAHAVELAAPHCDRMQGTLDAPPLPPPLSSLVASAGHGM